jgi:flagellar basal body P-ring protein FlgI
MNRPLRFLRAAASVVAAASLFVGLTSCQETPPKPKPPQYPWFGKRDVPEFMAGTIYQVTNLQNDQPFLVSGWGLVVNLDGTGGSRQLSNNVKAFMVKEMARKGFGSKLTPEFQDVQPEQVLLDRNAAIVAVYGWLPPAARKGQWFDLAIKAGADDVTSLAHGTLYDTELAIDGANAMDPNRRVNIWATAYGPVFVNPAYALNVSQNPDGATKRSLRSGLVLGGGQVLNDRPLLLRLREPERRLSKNIEFRINDAFHQDKVCTAFDEGYCQLWLPEKYADDWEHFAKLVQHVYLQGGSEAFARAKARQLVEEAHKPGAAIQDISYCWEGLGDYALAEIAPLMTDPSEGVRFAAARAAAYIGDPSGAAERALYDIASNDQSARQVAAVQVLGKVPNSRAINQLLRGLLASDQTTVRIEAYNILARNGDPSISRQLIRSANQPLNQKFVLDYVHCKGRPLIYATRIGVPRIAIFGDVPELPVPVAFSAQDKQLMIASQAMGREVTIFYRNARLRRPVQMTSPPDVADVLVRLAGQMDDGTGELDFTYAEILAILQSMSNQQKLRVTSPMGEPLAAAFVLQDDSNLRDVIDNAPSIERGRPQGETEAPKLDALHAGAVANPPERAGQASDTINSAAVAGRQ